MVNMNHLMKQAQNMQKKMQEMQEKLANEEFTGISGGSTVEVTITGKGDLKKVRIAPEIVSKDDVEVLEDLIVAAFNDAKRKSEEVKVQCLICLAE
jgi:DNA-binding YbaB/EbfC family protein